MNKFKRLIGKLTLPRNVVTIFGKDKYIEIGEKPIIDSRMYKRISKKEHYEFHYQRLEQSKFLGIWRLQLSWVSTNTKYH